MGRDAYLGADNIDTIDFGEPTIRFVRHGKHPLGLNVDLSVPNWMAQKFSGVSWVRCTEVWRRQPGQDLLVKTINRHSVRLHTRQADECVPFGSV